jgi:hypothetical protein
MIKFFRKIRQKMLTENKFSKYLIYAIGEIVLVVIGILIALQINNWNIRNQTLAELDSSFENLVEDVNKNKIQLLDLIKINENKINSCTMLLDNYEQQRQMTSKEFLITSLPLNYEIHFELNRNGIDKVVSSSGIKLKEFESIRNRINSYLLKANNIRIQDEKEALYIEDMEKLLINTDYLGALWKEYRLGRYMNDSSSVNIDFDFQKIMQNNSLLGIMLRTENVRPEINELYKNLIQKGENLINEINLYLKSK